MKVLDVYGKKDLDVLMYKKRPISTIMNEFFDKFPKEYRVNYDKNLEDLEILKVDESFDYGLSGEYYEVSNVLLFKNISFVPHELFHLASYDKERKQFAFCRGGDSTLCEDALIEGMTEYLASMAKSCKSKTYHFEVFAVSMLSSIERIFEPFFIPSYTEFIKLFPNKKDIISLMYSLDFYKTKIYSDDFSKQDMKNIRKAICDTIDSLIDIELSFDKEIKDREIYGEKFMDLITGEDVKNIVELFFKEYKDYSYEQVKKRVLRRM